MAAHPIYYITDIIGVSTKGARFSPPPLLNLFPSALTDVG